MCKTVSTYRPLDTLELTSDSKPNKSAILYNSRRNSKAITKAINGKLLYQNSEIHKDYQKAWYCNESLFQDGNKVTANYCKKRSCIVCARIMAARLMKAYAKPLLELNDLHLVTLTTPNVTGDMLDTEIDRMYNAYTKIKDNIRKTYKLKLKGFRKLEITHNSRTNTFNPHYHILVDGKEAATLIRDLWLNQFSNANVRGQDIKKVRSIKEESALLEVFKYVTKVVIKNSFNAEALDIMYCAIKGRRVYQAMGIKKTQEVKIKTYESQIITHRDERIEVWKWCNDSKDWYTPDHSESFNDSQIDSSVLKTIKVINNAKLTEDKKPITIETTIDNMRKSAQKIHRKIPEAYEW